MDCVRLEQKIRKCRIYTKAVSVEFYRFETTGYHACFEKYELHGKEQNYF